MRTTIYSLALMLAAAGFSACSDKWEPTTDKDQVGQLSKSSIEVVNSENVISRASVDVSNFIVTVLDPQGAVSGEWKYSEMPELITLPVADGYTAKVISHEQEKAAWDAPYFEGVSEKFNIENNKITQVATISCKLANIKVSIRYSDDLKKAMGDDCKVTVIANDEGMLEFLPTETRSGYFQAIEGSSTLVATFTGTVNGHLEEVRRVFGDVEAGQHRIITYKLKTGDGDVPDETGTIDPSTGISVDMSTIDESIEGNVSVDEDVIDGDRPGQEDPGDDPDPDPDPDDPTPPDDELFTFTSETIDFEGENIPEDGKSYIVKINSVNPLSHLIVDIISESLNKEMLQSVGLDSTFDLAYPGDLAEALSSSFHFPIEDQVIGQTEVTFDITNFVPLLNIYPNETHVFKLTVRDEKGNEKIVNLTFKS